MNGVGTGSSEPVAEEGPGASGGAPHGAPKASPEAVEVMAALRRRSEVEGFARRGHDERRREADALALLYPIPGDVRVTATDAGGVPAEWVEAPGTRRGHLLYLHGGGYTRGSLQSHRELVVRMARITGLRALHLDYRLAPEHPFPAALDDAEKAYFWLLDQPGVEPASTVVAGDSAGGGLAVALLTRLRDRAVSLPGAAVLLSPWTDLRDDAPAWSVHPDVDPVVSHHDFEVSAGAYLGSHPADHPMVSPQLGDLTGLPPLLVLVGGRELLLHDARGLAEAARSSGTPVRLVEEEELFHVWPLWAHLPESEAALELVREFVDSVIR